MGVRVPIPGGKGDDGGAAAAEAAAVPLLFLLVVDGWVGGFKHVQATLKSHTRKQSALNNAPHHPTAATVGRRRPGQGGVAAGVVNLHSAACCLLPLARAG